MNSKSGQALFKNHFFAAFRPVKYAVTSTSGATCAIVYWSSLAVRLSSSMITDFIFFEVKGETGKVIPLGVLNHIIHIGDFT
jgi:hypothetical protein